ncbi:MAG TPA: hypothetical protein DEH25_06540 [Chloroflexi bacterium]|nr:hypothetical protein [Chloroflexota bacterium]
MAEKRLYHSFFIVLMLLALFLSACTATPTPESKINVRILVDGNEQVFGVSPGSTVQETLDAAGITLGELDRVDPVSYTVLADQTLITVIRVREEFEVEQVVIPFEQQNQPSEFLSEGEQQPLQLGENGLQEITYRRIYENDIEISKNPIKVVTLKEPSPQIMLVGVKAVFTPLALPGRLVYLSDGNAWMLESSTANRIPVVTTGDLDGRIFQLSDDGEWLLFTRASEEEDVINTLWAINIDDPTLEIDLNVQNIIHFADWVPATELQVAFSTVESRQAAPGWQANNDLRWRDFSLNAWVSSLKTIVDTNSGGIYGWWGVNYAYGLAPVDIAYAGPDQVGLVNQEIITPTVLLEITPFQTRGDWAWVPGVSWAPDGQVIFTVDHAPPSGVESSEESPNFDLMAIPLKAGNPLRLVQDVGMFAYPLPSPILIKSSGERSYQVAYLQAIIPTQSESSRYRLVVLDRDGSNRHAIFPPPEAAGLDPQSDWGAWAPAPLPGMNSLALAVLYQGNIWLVDSLSAEAWQITGDGRINRLAWK